MEKQTKLEDFEAFKLIVEAYNIMVKRFREKKHKTESKPLKQTVLTAISENKTNGGLIE